MSHGLAVHLMMRALGRRARLRRHGSGPRWPHRPRRAVPRQLVGYLAGNGHADVPGAALITGGLMLGVYTIVEAVNHGWVRCTRSA